MMKKTLLLFFIFSLALTAVPFVYAQTSGDLQYTPLEPLPDVNESGDAQSLASVLNFVFRALFTFGGLMAVLFLILGGIAYMTSEVVDKKSQAKERIKGAVYGLLILILSYLILNTINPDLLKFNFSNIGGGGQTQSQNNGNGNGQGNSDLPENLEGCASSDTGCAVSCGVACVQSLGLNLQMPASGSLRSLWFKTESVSAPQAQARINEFTGSCSGYVDTGNTVGLNTPLTAFVCVPAN